MENRSGSFVGQVFWRVLFLILLGLGFLSDAQALNESPQTFTLDGRLYQAGSAQPLLDPNAKVKIQILNPSGTCLLYEEEQYVNTIPSEGYFHINVGSLLGSSKRTVSDPGRTMNQIFQNTGGIPASDVPGQTCAGGVYSPAAGSIRYFRVTVTPSTTNIADTLTPDIAIDSVPMAVVAQSVQGLEKANILQTAMFVSSALTQTNLESLFIEPAYSNLQSILAGNFLKTGTTGVALPSFAANPSSPSNGDLWFDSATGQIKYKNGSGVQVVGSGTIDLTDTGVSSGTYTKVTVDAKGRVTAGTVSLSESDIPNLTTAGKVSGNTIIAGTISGSTGVNTSGNLITTGTVSGLTVQATNLHVYNGANYIQMSAPALSGNVNLTLPADDGNAGEVLSTNGSGVLSWVSNVPSLGGAILNGGNSTGASISIGTNDNYALAFKVNNVTAMTISQNGNVGIGTTTPDRLLTLKAADNTNIFNVKNNAGNDILSLANNWGTGILTISDGTANRSVVFDPDPANGAFIFSNAGTVNKADGAATARGSGLAIGIPYVVGQENGVLFTNSTNAGGVPGAAVTSYTSSTATYGRQGLNFKTSSGTLTTRMTIDPDGNVGIGTTAPSTAVDISGAINLNGIAAPAVSASNEGRIYYDRSANKFKVSQNGAAYVDLVSSGGGITSFGGQTGSAQTLSISVDNSVALPTITSASNAHTWKIPMASVAGTTAGLLNKTDYDAFNAKLGTTTSFAGDVSGAYSATVVQKIQGKTITAASADKQIMIYNGTSWNNTIVSGDATLSNTGALTVDSGTTANKLVRLDASAKLPAVDGSALTNLNAANLSSAVPINKGGTAATSFGNNRIIASNGTGSALQAFTCSLNQVISFDASGNATCANANALVTGVILNGGNTTGADISMGTNDNFALTFKVNNATAMTISQGGNVGIGSGSPTARFEVVNSIVGTGNVGAFWQMVTNPTVSGGGIYATSRFYVTANSAQTSRGILADNYGRVATGFSQTGFAYGGKFVSLRNAVTGDGNGLSSNLTGVESTYGISDVAAVAPQATNVMGLRLTPTIKTGSVTNMYDIYIDPDVTGGTVANRWGIYQYGANKNYFAGDVGIGVGTSVPSSTLQVAGSIATKVSAKTADYTLTAADHIITANAASSVLTMTLPTAVGITGRQYTIKKVDTSSNAVTVATTSSQTIDGETTKNLSSSYQYLTVVSDGANWVVIGTNASTADTNIEWY